MHHQYFLDLCHGGAASNRGEYCISKAAIAMAGLLWATRLAEFEIPVYEVQPGTIETDMKEHPAEV